MTVFTDSRNYIPGCLWFPKHLVIFMSASIILLVADILNGNWWRFWPMMIWSILLAIHYFFASTLAINEDWAGEKATDVRVRAYDYDHIYSIDKRHQQTVTHTTDKSIKS